VRASSRTCRGHVGWRAGGWLAGHVARRVRDEGDVEDEGGERLAAAAREEEGGQGRGERKRRDGREEAKRGEEEREARVGERLAGQHARRHKRGAAGEDGHV